jgi:3-dehydroquinate synthase
MRVNSYRGEYTFEFSNLTNSLVEGLVDRSFLVIDANIYRLYPIFSEVFSSDNTFVVTASEETKTLKTCTGLVELLVNKGFKRNHRLIAVGGGVIQDITAFSASILYRGVDWVFLPTTLLAQADSCIGSKTSINFEGTKNLLGTFHPPREIYCCTEFLQSLSVDDIKSGIGEMLHYYLIDNTPLTIDLNNSYNDIIDTRGPALEKFILESLRIKRDMIQKDEFDKDQRRVFNYGHTFGHAIESITKYKISHGIAVTLGMDLANYISMSLGLIDRKTYDSLHKLLEKNLPTYKLPKDKLPSYLNLLSKDKKNIDNSLVCILPYGIGDIRITRIDDLGSISRVIQEYMET